MFFKGKKGKGTKIVEDSVFERKKRKKKEDKKCQGKDTKKEKIKLAYKKKALGQEGGGNKVNVT